MFVEAVQLLLEKCAKDENHRKLMERVACIGYTNDVLHVFHQFLASVCFSNSNLTRQARVVNNMVVCFGGKTAAPL